LSYKILYFELKAELPLRPCKSYNNCPFKWFDKQLCANTAKFSEALSFLKIKGFNEEEAKKILKDLEELGYIEVVHCHITRTYKDKELDWGKIIGGIFTLWLTGITKEVAHSEKEYYTTDKEPLIWFKY